MSLLTQCPFALASGRGRAEIAAAFHETVAAVAAACAAAAEPRTVVLSGGRRSART